MPKPSLELESLHKELSDFQDNIDNNYALDTWLQKTKTLKTLIETNRLLLPVETQKEQKKIMDLHWQLKRFQKSPGEEQAIHGIYAFVAILCLVVFFSFFQTAAAAFTFIGLVFTVAFLLWKRTQYLQKKISTKIHSIKRDIRYLSHTIENKILTKDD